MSSDATPPEQSPLQGAYTPSFASILDYFGITILVTTYQADRLVLLRSEGTVLNTHYRAFKRPMGLASDALRIALGTSQEIHIFRNFPPVCKVLEPPGRHDACYLHRSTHITGDVAIHEMAWVNDELWFVNTAFSCLCTHDGINSFIPRWRPPFISELAPDDRCHLNGMATVVDALGNTLIRYASAFSETNTREGWREHKIDGGIVMEVPSGKVVARGLSMPHSPRWYNGRLWVLESGRGGVCMIDKATGKVEVVAALPGFTRGLAFLGNLAFVGLSQVRDTALNEGIPIAQNPESRRNCGVWVIDITTGQTAGFVKFDASIQQVFEVQLLPYYRWPELVSRDDPKLLSSAYEIPPDAMAELAPALRPA